MLSKPHKVDALILVKNISFADLIKLNKNKDKKDLLIVALDPKSQAFLKNKNISFVTSELFLDPRAHKEILIESERILEEYHPIVKLLKFGDIHECIHNYINYNLLFKIREMLVIRSIINKIRMKEIVVIGLSDFLSKILIKWSYKENIKILTYSVVKYRYNFIKQIILKLTNLLFFEYKLMIYKFIFKNLNKNQLFLTSEDRKLSTVVNKVQNSKKKFGTIYLSSNSSFFFKNFLTPFSGEVIVFKRTYSFITKKYKADYLIFKKQISKAETFLKNKNKLKHQDFNFHKFLNVYLQKFILNECYDLFRSYIGLKRLLKKNKKNNLLLSQHALGFNGLAGEMAILKNFPSLLITHGSHVKQINKYSKLAWDHTNKILINAKFTYTAIQTKIAYEYFCNEHDKRTKPLITGPLIYGIKNKISTSKNLRQSLFKHNSKKFIILHAGTPKDWNFFRPVNYETTDEYISNLIEIIKAIKSNKNIFLAIRIRESKNLTLSTLKTLLPKFNNYGIYDKGNFMDYLHCSDLLMSYSSTTIEEALMNKKPVALFNPKGDYFHLKGTLLKKDKKNISINHIYNIKNRNDLEWSLNWLQKNHYMSDNSLDWKKYSFDTKKNNQFEDLIQEAFKDR